MASQMTQLEKVEAEINEVKQQIIDVEVEIKKEIDKGEKAALREEKKQLRKKEEQLREEKLLLLKKDAAPDSGISAIARKRQNRMHTGQDDAWEKLCRLQLGKALRNSRDMGVNGDDDTGVDDEVDTGSTDLFTGIGSRIILGIDFHRVPGNPDPPALENETFIRAVHDFADAANIPLTTTPSGQLFRKITPDVLAYVPPKAKKDVQFACSIFPTIWGHSRRPGVEDINADNKGVTSPPDSSPSSASTSPSKADDAPVKRTLPIVFELTTIETDAYLEKKLDQIERVLHYLIHANHAKLSSSSTPTPSVSVLLEWLAKLGAIAGFGVPSLNHCAKIKKLLDDNDVMLSRPCVKHLHTTSDLYFFVYVETVHSELASNASDISSLKRQLEQMERKVEQGQKQMERKVEQGQKQMERKVEQGQKQMERNVEEIRKMLQDKLM